MKDLNKAIATYGIIDHRPTDAALKSSFLLWIIAPGGLLDNGTLAEELRTRTLPDDDMVKKLTKGRSLTELVFRSPMLKNLPTLLERLMVLWPGFLRNIAFLP